MLFALSKLAGFLLQPSTLAMLAMGRGLWLLRPRREGRAGFRYVLLGFAYFVFAGLFPVGNALILPLEERFGKVIPAEVEGRIEGIIILGGFEGGRVTASRGGLAVNESAERLTEGLRLALAHPEAKVIFTGGVGSLFSGDVEATEPVSRFFRDAGVEDQRILLEGRSRNTYENALFTKAALQPRPGERFMLITSAYHMPRAIGLFRKAGFDVTAFPVDFRTRGSEDITRFFDRVPEGLKRVDLVVREWTGLVAYRVLGRTDDLFPAPN
jgi:uncharacterized SAM-binding protein YcdF (DUF218 family)